MVANSEMVQDKFAFSGALPENAAFDVNRIHGKRVVITGGCSGIGEAAVRSFVAAGACVTLGDLDTERGAKLVTELGADNVLFVKCDVRAWEDQLALFQAAASWSPQHRIDVVVANAGILGADDLCRSDPDAESPTRPNLSIVETNLYGVLYTIRLATYYFSRQPDDANHDRCLIMTSSVAAYIDIANSPQYAAAKSAIRTLMHSFRRATQWTGMRVNTIAPFFIATRLLPRELFHQIEAADMPLAKVEDAAQAVLHLAADNSINGRTLFILNRSICPRGYKDLQVDDEHSHELLKAWQVQALKIFTVT